MRSSDSAAAVGPDETFAPYTPDVRTILEAVYRSRKGCFYVTHTSNNMTHTGNNLIQARNKFLREPQFDTDPGEQIPPGISAESLKARAAKVWRWLLND